VRVSDGRSSERSDVLPGRWGGVEDSPLFLHDGRLPTLEDSVQFFNLDASDGDATHPRFHEVDVPRNDVDDVGRLLCLLLPLLVGGGAARAGGECSVRLVPGDDVQAAIDRVAPSRGTVCLGAGEFRLRRFLSIAADGVALRGEGPATVLRLDDGVQSAVVVVGDHRARVPARPVEDVAIERLRIVGGGPGGDESSSEFPYLTNSAVVIRTGHRIALRELDVSACRSACVLTERDTRDVVIEDSTIGPSVWDGIAFNRTRGARVVGNTIHDATAAGITAEHLEDALIERNLVRHNGSHGIYLADSYNNEVRDDGFEDDVDAGVFLTCSVRDRDPGRVRCWDGSMSQGNTFEHNAFVRNRRAYVVAADAAASCRAPGFVHNVSRGDDFGGAAVDQDVARFGVCLVVEK
jgi:hypothetical protein